MNVTGWPPNMAWDCTINVTDPSGGECEIQIQLLDFAGNNLAVKGVVYFYFSSDATGDVIIDMDACDISTTYAYGDLLEILADNYYMVVSEDNGRINIMADDDTTTTGFLNVVLPNGKVKNSATFKFDE